MAWLDYLIEAGFLNPEQNPEPVAVEKGYTIPYWDALGYLEKVAEGFPGGANLEMIDPILDVIRKASEQPRDNYRTWYTFIKLLSRMPGEKIPEDILHFIPVWLDGKFDTMLQTAELFGSLLPKFLGGSSPDDDKKAAIVLSHLFQLRRYPGTEDYMPIGKSYYSRVYKYYFRQAFADTKLAANIATHLFPDIAYTIADQINLLIRDYSISVELASGGNQYLLVLIPEEMNLTIKISNKINNDLLHSRIIENYLSASTGVVLSQLMESLDESGIPRAAFSKEMLDKIEFSLTHDYFSVFGYNAIQDLQEDNYSDDTLVELFALALRQVLGQFAKHRPDCAKPIMSDFAFKPCYDLPFYKRMIFYVMAENWKDFHDLFFAMIETTDKHKYFSSYVYHSELHYLLRNVQHQLTDVQAKAIKDILDRGLQSGENRGVDEQHWKHRWLDALKLNHNFASEYEYLTAKLGLEKADYSEEGKVKVRVGNLSPYTAEQILEMEDGLLLSEITNFKNRDRFDDPTAEGFAEQLMKAAEVNPSKFVDHIENYKAVSFNYIYYLFLGLTNAWKNSLDFDWGKLLDFVADYLASDSYCSADSVSRDPGKTPLREWIAGTFGRLISEGTRNHQHSFDISLLGKAKTILLLLVKDLANEPAVPQGETIDYPMHSLNSVHGQVLRAALDYSLRKAASEFPDSSVEVKWDTEIKQAYTNCLDQSILDSYVLIGMYFKHFYYLDGPWSELQVKRLYEIKDQRWDGFMGGLGFTSPGWDRSIYTLLYPHYHRAVVETLAINTEYHYGLIRHVTAYFFWNFESLGEKSLIKDLIERGDIRNVKGLIRFFSEQSAYLDKYSKAEQQNIRVKAIQVWEEILKRLAGEPVSVQEEVLELLLGFSSYIEELNGQNIKLLNASIPHVKDYHSINTLLDILNTVKKQSDQFSASSIASILTNFKTGLYLHDEQQQQIKHLVTFLFENGEQAAAEKLCNRYSLEGYSFLKDIYYQYRQ